MKRIAVSSFVVLSMLSVPTMAMAMMDGSGDEHRGGDGNGGHHGNAPEPITVLGLAAGAGGIAVAGWRSRRAARKQK